MGAFAPVTIFFVHKKQKYREIANKKEVIISGVQAKALIERIKSDIAFNVRLVSIKNVNEKLKFIYSEGYIWNEEEFRDAEMEAHSTVGEQRGGYWLPYSFYTRQHL